MPTKRRRPNPENKTKENGAVPFGAALTEALKLKKSRVSKPDKSWMECVYITPEIAEEWLKRNTNNRPVSVLSIVRLKEELTHGTWKINGETIKFDVMDILRDGQTRLQSIMETGLPAWCWVCFGINEDCFDSIDQVRGRNLGHLLAMRKTRNYNSLAHAVKILYTLDDSIEECPGGFRPSVGLDVLAERKELEASLDFVLSVRIQDVYSSGSAAALHCLMKRVDIDLADSYWTSIGSGVVANKKNPARFVRDMLVANKMAGKDKQLTPTSVMAIIIKGWCLLRRNATCQYIRWNGNEGFPSIT